MPSRARIQERGAWPTGLAVALSLFLLLQCLVMAYSTPAGAPPDEYAHLSYVDDVARGRLIPDYADGRIRGSDRGNYLAHPPLYYTIVGKIAGITGLDPFKNAKALRIPGAVFLAGGFLCWLLAARTARVPALGGILATVAVCAIPMFSYVGGSVSNDTLLCFGVGLFAYGLTREWIAGLRDRRAAAAIIGGSAIVFLTKSTGAAFLVFLLLALLPWNRAALAWLATPRQLKIAAAVAAICGPYFVFSLLAYGSVMPRPEPLYQPSPPAEPLAPAAYLVRYVQAMWERLPIIMAHVNVRPFAPYGALAMKAMLLLPLLVWGLSRPGARRRGIDPRLIRATDALALATLATLLLHAAYTYTSYRTTGLMAGIQPRYFAFLLPALWLPAFLLERPGRLHAALLAAWIACAVAAFWTSVPFTLQKQAAAAAAAKERRNAPPPAKAPAKKLDGHLDDLRLSPAGQLHVRGWAFDTREGSTVARIAVFVDGSHLADVQAGEPRPDVARALGDPAAAGSGFSTVLEGTGAGARDCAVAVAAEADEGSVLWLRRASCGSQPRLP